MSNNRDDLEDKGGKWLTTFNDMVTLLLTFMVLVLSLSTLDTAKVKEASHSFSSACGFLQSGKIVDIKVFTPFVNPRRGVAITDHRVKRELSDHINEIGGINAVVVEERVSTILRDTLLFETGLAEIKVENRQIINALCSILKETDCRIRIEGHTDDVPINSILFLSNWELSTARAVNVTKYFISEGGISPERLSVASYADSKPLFPNMNDHNRELNRRVEVLLILNGNDGGSNND
ncbi:MAG: flagellar motor protein MotB [Deltaproteobacteria bacterium]|nr:flagellar motor protein MotB [Deltaproteobacteria bacterium]